MNKLTAKKCKTLIGYMTEEWEESGISTKEELYLQALEIALPVLEQQEEKKQVSLREGVEASRKLIAESGGYNFDALRAEQDNDGWVEWGGGKCPVRGDILVEVEFRGGAASTDSSNCWCWENSGEDSDIIAYRVVEQERERGEEA